MSNNFAAPPQECLHEHLNYFNENIQGFDDIFSKDFDLLFDPLMMTPDAGPTQTSAVMVADIPSHSAPIQQAVVHRPQQIECEPIPYNVPSTTSYAAPPQSVAHPHHYAQAPMPVSVSSSNPYANVGPATVTPPAAPKPVVSESVIQMVGAATISPPATATVFKAAPKAKAAPMVTKSAPRKRSYSVAVPEPEPTSSDDIDTSNMTFQEQEDLRRERNRHHAKRSRQRKRTYMSQLEDAVGDMRKENERLFELLGMDSARAKANMAKEQELKSVAATDRFIQGLKQPRNRVLDNTTLAFLRELWK